MVYAADRENWRLQMFPQNGTFVKQRRRTETPFASIYVLARPRAAVLCRERQEHHCVDRKTSRRWIDRAPGIGAAISSRPIEGQHLYRADHERDAEAEFKGMSTASR
jgi:hypothetical protein